MTSRVETPGAVEYRLPFRSAWRSLTWQRRLHGSLMYTIMVGLGIVFLMPLSWMLTAALRGEGEVVVAVDHQHQRFRRRA